VAEEKRRGTNLECAQYEVFLRDIKTCLASFVYAISMLCAPHAVTVGNAQDLRTGEFEVTYQPAELLDPETLSSVSDVISADAEITWEMYVPDTCDPGNAAGLMVYISPTPKGTMPEKWRSVIDDENLIYIGANDSGNKTHTARRMLYSVLGPRIAAREYNIDKERIYLSGFSGGGKVASPVSVDFPNLFRGAIYICGAEDWDRHPPKLLDQFSANRYVFLSGQADFNRDLTKDIYRRYKRAGIPNIKMMVVPRMRHANPGTRDFRAAVHYLDHRE
jgi:hypothetical protein